MGFITWKPNSHFQNDIMTYMLSFYVILVYDGGLGLSRFICYMDPHTDHSVLMKKSDTMQKMEGGVEGCP